MGSFRNALASPQFLAALAAPLALVGATSLQRHLERKRGVVDKATAYREMLASHPHLAEKDQGEVGRIFNSLHRASPHMAKDPMVAGAWIDNILENKTPGMRSHQGVLNAVKDLSGIEKNVTDSAKNQRGMTLDWGQTAASSIVGMTNALVEARRYDIDQARQHANDEISKSLDAHNLAIEKFQREKSDYTRSHAERVLQHQWRENESKTNRAERNDKLRGMIRDIRSARQGQGGRGAAFAAPAAAGLAAAATGAAGAVGGGGSKNPFEDMHFGARPKDPGPSGYGTYRNYQEAAGNRVQGRRDYDYSRDTARGNALKTPEELAGQGSYYHAPEGKNPAVYRPPEVAGPLPSFNVPDVHLGKAPESGPWSNPTGPAHHEPIGPGVFKRFKLSSMQPGSLREMLYALRV